MADRERLLSSSARERSLLPADGCGFSSKVQERRVLTGEGGVNLASALLNVASPEAGGTVLSLSVGKVENCWGTVDCNAVFIHTDEPLKAGYAELQQVEGSFDQITVKVLKHKDAKPETVHVAFWLRKDLSLGLRQIVNLSQSKNPPAACWDTISLNLTCIYSMKPSVSGKTSKSWNAIANALILRCKSSGCPLIDSYSYIFNVGEHRFVAAVRLESSKGAQKTGGLLTSSARVVKIGMSEAIKSKLDITDTAPAVNEKKLAEKFVFKGERYGIGGVNNHIRQFVDEFIAPRLLTGDLQRKIKCNISRGGILSGPPGTGKTLFISVLESLLQENGFTVSSKIISGPEVFNKYVGASEENVRAIFSGDETDEQVIRLILIDEIDSMLPVRGGASGNDGGERVVNQFLTCLDGIDKKNNLIVFGTTNRPDLIDPAVMRPGRMNMKMQFNLPEKEQRLQILNIQVKDLLDSGMLNTDVTLAKLTERAAGFSGAELGALVEKAKVSALRKEQGLSGDDTYFCPQAISALESLDVRDCDFDWAFTQIQPQFGKSDFMPLEGKSLKYKRYPSDIAEKLKTTLDHFRQDDARSTLRILIKGPAGSGKSTLAALTQREFGSFCSYVSAVDVVKSRDRRMPLVDAFSGRNHYQDDPHGRHAVVIDDFDTMINFDGVNYDRGMVSTLDAYTKQSLTGVGQGKLLALITATEHADEAVNFLPRLFPKESVFRTVCRDMDDEFQKRG